VTEKKTKYGIVIPNGYLEDICGNIMSYYDTEIKDGKIYVSYHYLLEPGKVTLRGEHMKLELEKNCIHQDRLSCNYGKGFSRCECMKYVDRQWKCIKN
jgi:hypothetical protein